MEKQQNSKTELLLCLFLGWAGGHKFYNKKIGMGVLYLLTFGLFFIGWLGDLILLCILHFGKPQNAQLSKTHKIGSYGIALFCVLVLGSCAPKSEPAEIPPETTATAITTTEATVEPTETTIPTEATETATPTEPTTESTAETSTAPTETEPVGTTYVLNTSTMKFHHPDCSSADDIKDINKGSFAGTREEVISQGYEPCGRCNP